MRYYILVTLICYDDFSAKSTVDEPGVLKFEYIMILRNDQ